MLDVFEDLLYFTTFPLPGVGRINKFGQGNVTRLAEGIRAASDLVIIQASKQSRNGEWAMGRGWGPYCFGLG